MDDADDLDDDEVIPADACDLCCEVVCECVQCPDCERPEEDCVCDDADDQVDPDFYDGLGDQ